MSYVSGIVAGIRYAQTHTDHAGAYLRAFEAGQAEELTKILAVAGKYKDLNALIAWLENRQRHVEILSGADHE